MTWLRAAGRASQAVTFLTAVVAWPAAVGLVPLRSPGPILHPFAGVRSPSGKIGFISLEAPAGASPNSCSTGTSSLTISGAAPGNFTASLTGSDQKVYTSLGTYSASNTTCSGWTVQFQAAQFRSGSGDLLPSGSLLMPAPTVSNCQSSCGSGSTSNPPSICIHGTPASLDGGSAVTVASAALNTGDGKYTFTPGTIGSGKLELTVPSYAYATTYTSTLTVTIAQGPASSC